MNQTTNYPSGYVTANMATMRIVDRLPGLLEGRARMMAQMILGPILCPAMAVFGLTTNAVNLAVFFKQGFKDNITLYFAVLAFFDSASLLALLWLGIAGNPLVSGHPDVPFNALQIIQLTASVPRSYFSRLSSVVTVYISIERCISVIKPLDVKNMFTRRTFLIAMLCSVFFYTISLAPTYYTTRFTWKTNPVTNTTYLGIYYSSYYLLSAKITQPMEALSSVAVFVVITVCAVFLTKKLQERKNWMGKEDETNKGNFLSAKDKRAALTVILLAVMFVVCYTITTMCRIFMSAFKEFNRGGRYMNFYLVMWMLGYLMEALCASSNIFVYVSTSSKYKEVLLKFCRCCAFSKKE